MMDDTNSASGEDHVPEVADSSSSSDEPTPVEATVPAVQSLGRGHGRVRTSLRNDNRNQHRAIQNDNEEIEGVAVEAEGMMRARSGDALAVHRRVPQDIICNLFGISAQAESEMELLVYFSHQKCWI